MARRLRAIGEETARLEELYGNPVVPARTIRG